MMADLGSIARPRGIPYARNFSRKLAFANFGDFIADEAETLYVYFEMLFRGKIR